MSTLKRRAPDCGPGPCGGSWRRCQTVSPASVSERHQSSQEPRISGWERHKNATVRRFFSHPAWLRACFSSGLRLVPPLQRAQRRTLNTVHVNTDSRPQAVIRSKSIDSSAITSFCIECLFGGGELLFGLLTNHVKISSCAS